jgi:NADH:ubiquinone oxidoreductase subunit 6 (subunit J)
MVQQIVFGILTIMVIGGGLGVVTTRNIYYAALFLSLSLSGMAGYFVLLNAGFLAAVQIVIYVGAIAILILFAIMLSRKIMTTNEAQTNQQSWLALGVVAVLYAVLIYMILNVNWPISAAEPTGDSLTQLGLSFLGGYVIPFEVISVLLLVAMIGAIILARDTGTE